MIPISTYTGEGIEKLKTCLRKSIDEQAEQVNEDYRKKKLLLLQTSKEEQMNRNWHSWTDSTYFNYAHEAFFVQTFHLIVPSSIIACFPPFVQALGYGTVEKEASLFGFVLVFFNLCWLQNPSMWKPKYVQLKILLNNWWSLEYFLPSERNGGNITCTKEQVQQLHMSRGHQKNQGKFLIEEFSKSGASKVNWSCYCDRHWIVVFCWF